MKCMDKHEFEQQNVFGTGAANTAYAKFFIGQSFLNPLTDPKTGLFLANVTFEPGCRNNWHTHHVAGQMLICVGGHGWYQEWGKPARHLAPGDFVYIAPEVKHWHGAVAGEAFAHLALSVPQKGATNEWLEPVTDEEYAKRPSH